MLHDDDPDASGGEGDGSPDGPNNEQGKDRDAPCHHQGKLLMMPRAPAAITYQTDLKLLNEGREKLE